VISNYEKNVFFSCVQEHLEERRNELLRRHGGASVKPPMPLDKYAKDAETWLIYARINYDGARVLFTHERALTLCFPAASLGHHALEALIKTALIRAGMTIFDPAKLKRLDPSTSLSETDCAWGHELLGLGKLLASKRPDFDLRKHLNFVAFPRETPMDIETGLTVFDPFFWELRYPQQLKELDGIGPDDVGLLDALFAEIMPFARA
jgi:hypothetical protein